MENTKNFYEIAIEMKNGNVHVWYTDTTLTPGYIFNNVLCYVENIKNVNITPIEYDVYANCVTMYGKNHTYDDYNEYFQKYGVPVE